MIWKLKLIASTAAIGNALRHCKLLVQIEVGRSKTPAYLIYAAKIPT